ncbi:cyclic nucleotide-binding domain-containing protein, partial [Oscillatoriales cyanobacterium LEGE 11467]
MTQTVSQPQISAFLAQVSPFERLGKNAIEGLAAKCQLLRYRIGQQILVRDKLPAQVSIIYQGQVRLLGYDHRSQKSASLKTVGAGDMFGWLGLVRGVSCETAIASTETICLTIPAMEFLELLKTKPNFSSALKDRVEIAELFELLSLELERRADAGSNLKDLALQMLEDVQVLNIPSGAVSQTQLDANRTWLVSSGSVGEHPTGSRLPSPYLPSSLRKGVRLIGVMWPEQKALTQSGSAALEEDGSHLDPWDDSTGEDPGAIV